MGCAAAPTPRTSVYPTYRVLRFCCRFPADRQQAGLLRPAARIKSDARRWNDQFCSRPENPPRSRFCPEGVGVRLADDGLRSGPKPMHLGASDRSCSQVLLPLRARSRASDAPTASGQNQKPLKDAKSKAVQGCKIKSRARMQNQKPLKRHSAEFQSHPDRLKLANRIEHPPTITPSTAK